MVLLKKEVVMLVLCRKIIAKLFIEHIKSKTQMEVIGVYEWNKVRNVVLVHHPTIALVEIPERHGEPAQEALDVCADIKKTCPECQIIMMCLEQDKKSIDVCVDAKRNGKIEDYIFYDTTPEYLTSKLEALLPKG